MVSVLKRMNIGVCSDVSQIEDMDAFVELFNKRIIEHGIQYDEQEEGVE